MTTYFIAGSLYYPSEVENPGSGFIELDATTSLEESFESEVSSHPVQVGANVTDHVRTENPTFDIKGSVSDYSPTRPSRDGSLLTSPGTKDGIRARAKEAYDMLLKMRQQSQLFTLVTKYEAYPNCVIKSIKIDHSSSTGGSLNLVMKVEQLRLVTAASTILAINKASPDDSRGTKNNGTSSKGSTDTATLSSIDRVLGTSVFGDAINDIGD